MSGEAIGGLRPVHLAVAGENRIEEMVSVLLEAGAKLCVVTFEVTDNTWGASKMTDMRALEGIRPVKREDRQKQKAGKTIWILVTVAAARCERMNL